METMSKLEQELIQRLASLSKCKMVVEESETTKQLRDELAAVTERAERAERDLAKAKELEQPRMVTRHSEKIWEITSSDGARVFEPNAKTTDGYYPFFGFCSLRAKEVTADELRSWLPEQQPGEVLFQGVRWMTGDIRCWGLDRLLMTKQTQEYDKPVHVTIRKAGE